MNDLTDWMSRPFDHPVPDLESPLAPHVYAVGKIEARLPNLGLEKEFARATGRTGLFDQADGQTLASLLGQRGNRYLARQLCWVLRIDGHDAYRLFPRDPADIDGLLAREGPDTDHVDVVIGVLDASAPPTTCSGLPAASVACDQIYSFKRDAFIKAIPRPAGTTDAQFALAAAAIQARIAQLTANTGATPAHRALNYLTTRYPALYGHAVEQYQMDSVLTAADAQPCPVSGARTVVDVVFSYTSRQTNFTEKSAVRVDVTDEFPFLVTGLTPCYDRGAAGR
jgi:hypothetical protein